MSHQDSFLLAQPDDFEQFWAFYPRRVAKIAAQKAWSRLGQQERAAAINGIEKVVVSARIWAAGFWHVDLQFVPYPATYLNGKRWNDEVVQSAPQVGQGPSPELPFGCRACRKRFLSAAERDAHECGRQP